jgi:hypothetical protein
VISNDLSGEEKVSAIAQRQLALEAFLKEYVVCVTSIINNDVAARKVTPAEEKA